MQGLKGKLCDCQRLAPLVSDRADEVQCEAEAFKFGDRGGSFTAFTPLAASVPRNSAVNSGSRSWIRYLFPVKNPSPSSQRLRATWPIQIPSALVPMPAISTRRVERSIRKSTRNLVRPDRVHTSTVKKSAVAITSQCRFRNSFHVVFRLRSGAGSKPCCLRMFAMVPRATSWPRLANAP
jgi:hypothetical protein